MIPEGGRDVVIELAEQYFEEGYVIYCDRFFSHLDLAAYLRTRSTGLVGTGDAKTAIPSDLQYLVNIMHPLTWTYKWYNVKAKIDTTKRKEAHLTILEAEEPVCLLVWMDKKYRTQDKKVLFITNCTYTCYTDLGLARLSSKEYLGRKQTLHMTTHIQSTSAEGLQLLYGRC